MISNLFQLRRLLLLIALFCLGLLAFGWYLQTYQGQEPCPMCIVQRYAMVLVALIGFLGAACPKVLGQKIAAGGVILVALAGFGTALRQSWLQWYPPEFFSCGRDPFNMVNKIPLADLIPKVFAGQGDCTAVHWTFLGGSIANWSLLCFAGIIVALVIALIRRGK